MRPASIQDVQGGQVHAGDTRESVSALSAGLFDLRAALEADLRALTWIQRSLEGVRSGCAPGDPDLLLGEMDRVLTECVAAAERAGVVRVGAIEQLRQIIEARRAVQSPRQAVEVFAAA